MSTDSEGPVIDVTTESVAPVSGGAGTLRISEYWPDLPHKITPAAEPWDRPTVPLPTTPSPARGSRKRWVAVVALALLVAVSAAIIVDRRSPDAPPPSTDPPAVEAATPPFRITAPLSGRRTAVLVLATDTAALRVRTGATDGDLYRASSPRGGSVRPAASIDGDTVLLELKDTGGSGAGALDVQLSADVRWTVRVDASMNNADIDLSRTEVEDIRLAGDAADLALRLPQPRGVLSVVVTGGINRLRVTSPAGTPVRVRAGGGMGRGVIAGKNLGGVAKGEVFETGPWRQATDKVDVNARAGLGELWLDVD